MDILILKLVATPLLILGASLAGRRWGESVSGWFVGLPLTSGPVVFFLALEEGAGFAASAAQGCLAGTAAEAGFTLGYAIAARHAGWGTPLPSDEGRGIAFAQYENEEAYVATVAEVQVDRTSGELRVKRIVVAHDCGLVINPDGLRNQIEGNVIQSTSRALKEQVTFDGPHITSVDWESYPILKFSQVPSVEILVINRPDQPAMGAGEPSTITTAAAIANALFAASGARVREVPFTPKRIRAALGGKEED